MCIDAQLRMKRSSLPKSTARCYSSGGEIKIAQNPVEVKSKYGKGRMHGSQKNRCQLRNSAAAEMECNRIDEIPQILSIPSIHFLLPV